ncbi:natural resistance-associated macrophage protein-domain-containing protein [Polychytrium aggregatum]|uniref:natural resistance-associated macrophage protein-domain-containing protein n=1 Tax=Polychytrium aggregatum TaxID=110093 RepID=UPI0022FE1CA7|nr:natural resistance-associated macrophage protein-domain-containing protein [Polychytrium aggregatum]KAI9203851.1 natural resistance-associated macrophage protein-domain-containing protein [Polychytrium aggregatum]
MPSVLAPAEPEVLPGCTLASSQRGPRHNRVCLDWASWVRTLLSFMGPGYIVAVGYMDPGNWATDLQGGSSYQYKLLFVILFSNVFAVLFQGLAAKIGVVTGRDLGQLCRKHFHPWLNYVLYVTAELGVIATDLAEVIGAAISLNLLLGIPLVWGILLTTLDVLVVLATFQAKYLRIFEFIIIAMVLAVGVCYGMLLNRSSASALDVLKGYLPLDSSIFTDPATLYVGMGILGATIMPHNLFIHSRLVQYRSPRQEADPVDGALSVDPQQSVDLQQSVDVQQPARMQECSTENMSGTQEETRVTVSGRNQEDMAPEVPIKSVDGRIRSSDPLEAKLADGYINPPGFANKVQKALSFAFIDSFIALTFALYVNSAILIVSAALFYNTNQQISDIPSAYELLKSLIAPWAATVFALALLCSGQSSSITGTLAGQIVMEGFLKLQWPLWVRRLATRTVTIIPAVIVVIVKGDAGLNGLLVLSQVVLSGCLPFALWPLLWFSSSKKVMSVHFRTEKDLTGSKSFANSWFIFIFSFVSIALITVLNGIMIYQAIAGAPS